MWKWALPSTMSRFCLPSLITRSLLHVLSFFYDVTSKYKHMHSKRLMAFFWDYPGEPVLDKTFTYSPPWGRRRRIRMDNKVHCVKARPLYSALSQRWLLDSIRPAYNQSRPDGLLRLTASTFNLLWISMPAVLITVLTVMQNSLHLLSTSSIFARRKTPYVMQK